MDPWWLVLLALLLPLALAVSVIGGILWLATGRLAPRKMSRNEQKQLTAFSDKILGVVERVKVPYPVLIVLTAKDVLRGKESTFLKNIIEDSKSLKTDFAELQKTIE